MCYSYVSFRSSPAKGGHVEHADIDPHALAMALLYFSPFRNIRMAAVIFDKNGIISFGFNHLCRDGTTRHAEEAALAWANPVRLPAATVAVAGMRFPKGRRPKGQNTPFSTL